MSVLVAAFYRFVPLSEPHLLQARLARCCREQGILGTILLSAQEGINGTIAGTPAGVAAVFAWLSQVEGLEGLSHQPSWAPYPPFDRLKVRVKREIVSLRAPADPRVQVGEYVAPEAWNAVLRDPAVVVVDVRNRQEIALGTFVGAVDPQTDIFSEFPSFAAENLDPSRPVAMFCTGGIRCEKATSYLLSRGFSRVLHLQGGILGYLRQIPAADSLWQGECFVFDQRHALDHDLQPRFMSQAVARSHLQEGWPARSAEAMTGLLPDNLGKAGGRDEI